MSDFPYNFNRTDYIFSIKLLNGTHEVELKPGVWDYLTLHEDIFRWWTVGSIEINSSNESLERGSDYFGVVGIDEKQVNYKFRNDGRDTIFIKIRPKDENLSISDASFDEKRWHIELDCVIYQVEDLAHSSLGDKRKKLFFHEKTYQLMLEKNTTFSTSTVGENAKKEKIYKLTNEERSLPSGEAIKELLKNDPDFSKHAENTDNTELWDLGSKDNKIFYNSPSNYKFIDDLYYLLENHISSEENNYMPCLLKFERNGENKPKQFSLISFKKLFEKAGKSVPGEYQLEHIFLEENSENHNKDQILIKKAPLNKDSSVNGELKATHFTDAPRYQLIDMSGMDYSTKLFNRNVVAYNSKDGQWNIEMEENKAEKFKDFFKNAISQNVMTNLKEDRLPITRFLKDGYNTEDVYSIHPSDKLRLADGRNAIIKNYLFQNLAISLDLRGLTQRQPGRFFGLSKSTENTQEHDNKLEGQYLTVNVIHLFSTSSHSYSNKIIGIKTHTYQEKFALVDDDVITTS